MACSARAPAPGPSDAPRPAAQGSAVPKTDRESRVGLLRRAEADESLSSAASSPRQLELGAGRGRPAPSVRPPSPIRSPRRAAPPSVPASVKRRFEQQEMMIRRQVREQWKDLCYMFQRSDTNGDGSLDPNELRKLLYSANILLETSHFKLLVHAMDTDGDGQISYEEFLKYFHLNLPNFI